MQNDGFDNVIKCAAEILPVEVLAYICVVSCNYSSENLNLWLICSSLIIYRCNVTGCDGIVGLLCNHYVMGSIPG